MLEKDKTPERIARHSISAEDFTPDEIVEKMFSLVDDKIYKDFSKTYLDPCAGIGNMLVYLYKKRINKCKTLDDSIKALETIYGIELMQDNIDECKKRLYNIFIEYGNKVEGKKLNNKILEKINNILNNNIVCSSIFDWDVINWKSTKQTQLSLF